MNDDRLTDSHNLVTLYLGEAAKVSPFGPFDELSVRLPDLELCSR